MTYETSDFSEEELFILKEIERKKKRKKLIIISSIALVTVIFLTITITALVYNPNTSVPDIVEQYDF